MRYYDHDVRKLKGDAELQYWTMKFCAFYAESKIYEKYFEKKKDIEAYHICCHKGRINTVRKHLLKLGLIIDTDYHILHPLDTEVEKILAGYAIEPTFNDTGKIKKTSYSIQEETELVKTRLSCYRDVDDLDYNEVIYIYLHQDEYDFLATKTKHRHNSYCNEYVSEHQKVYPIKLIDTVEENIFKEKANYFARDNINTTISRAFGIKVKELYGHIDYWNDNRFNGGDYTSTIKFHGNTEITHEDISKRISEVAKHLRILHRAYKELRVLGRKIKQMGDTEFSRQLRDAATDHILEMSPLWINGEDQKLKELATMFLKGTSLISTTEKKY